MYILVYKATVVINKLTQEVGKGIDWQVVRYDAPKFKRIILMGVQF